MTEEPKKETINHYMTRKEWKELKSFKGNAQLLQFTLGLQLCKTKNDVIELLRDIQYHTIEDFKEQFLSETIEDFEKHYREFERVDGKLTGDYAIIVENNGWEKFKTKLLGDKK